MDDKKAFVEIKEKTLHPLPGFLGLFLSIMMLLAAIGLFVFTVISEILLFPCMVGAFLLFAVAIISFAGLKVVNPNEALVLTLFGKYYGTIKNAGFHMVNPFAAAYNPSAERTWQRDANGNVTGQMAVNKKISTKVSTLNNGIQKVNDVLGNPIVIGAVVIWRVAEPTKAAFAVENYKTFLSTQCDSTIRNIARLYPYDDVDDTNEAESYGERTLRGSSQEIADGMLEELQRRVECAGLEIMEVRITHLSYAEEIAAAMLQRQQAVAVIAARQKIVEGAVSMVEMALNKLSENDVVCLDDERKAQMVSNLLVVLCGNKEAQPIVNSGSVY